MLIRIKKCLLTRRIKKDKLLRKNLHCRDLETLKNSTGVFLK